MYLRSDITNAIIPVKFSLADSQLVDPKDTNGVPARAKISVRSDNFNTLYGGQIQVPVETVLRDFSAFTFVVEHDRKTYQRHFTAADVQAQIAQFEMKAIREGTSRIIPRVTVNNSPGSIIAPSGGVNTVVNEAPPPGLTVDENTETKNSDGSATYRWVLTIVAPYPIGNLYIEVRGQKILSWDVAPQSTGGLDIKGNSGKRPDFVFTNIPNAHGRYIVIVHTAAPTHLEAHYGT
jgi:hypothetical protein